MKTQTALLVVVTVLLPCGLLSAQDTGQEPNILWIITDDQRPDSIVAFNRIRRGDANSPLGTVTAQELSKEGRDQKAVTC